MTATAARRFFERRLSLITRAFGSPKTPHTVCSGRKPRKQYASTSRRIRKDRRAIQSECQIPRRPNTQNLYAMHSFLRLSAPHFTHSNPRRPKNELAKCGLAGNRRNRGIVASHCHERHGRLRDGKQ
jgi:hypothetical protein